MKRWLLLAVCCLAAVGRAGAWGQKGHDVTACIAEAHLTPEAAERIERILGGRSMVYEANWMDQASHTPPYAATLAWHYFNIDDGRTAETQPRNPAGDLLSAVTELAERLRDGGLPAAEERDALRMLIHLAGDMHCPMHAGRSDDRGGNDIAVTFFGEESNLHAVWDTALPEAARRWSYTEWCEQTDRLTDDEAALIGAGTPCDWIEETRALCSEVYEASPAGSNLSYDYVARFAPVVELQFLKGGYRLARLLNDIYQ